MSDELKNAEAELEALQKQKADRLKAEADGLRKEQAEIDRVKMEMTAKKERDSLKQEIIEAIGKNQPNGIELAPATKKPKSDLSTFRSKYLKNHKYVPIEYGSVEWVTGGYDFIDSDSGCDNDVSDWTPNETFADMIWGAFYCKGQLAGKVTVRGVDFTRGKGDTVSIRIRGKRTAQGPLGPCECLSCVSSSFTKVSLHLDSYGDLAEICELDLQFAGDVVKDGILEDMSDALAEQVDTEIWSQLITSGAAHVHLDECCSGPSLDSCCFQAIGLYNLIITQEADMRYNGYRPDKIILGPQLAAYFKYQQANSQQGFQVSFDGNKLSKIGSMDVIEYNCATVCSTVTNTTVAVILDSSRAVGEGWGMKPKMEQDRNIDCDSTTVAIHMYVGIDELDTGAIRLIRTPDAC
jgi:uncharacterized protein YuzB (UPF0349 family)